MSADRGTRWITRVWPHGKMVSRSAIGASKRTWVSFAKGVTSGYLPLGGVIAVERVHEAIDTRRARPQIQAAATLFRPLPFCCASGFGALSRSSRPKGFVERAA